MYTLPENLPPVKRNRLFNPGPGTTTDTVKYAQVVPDICPREKEFGEIMDQMGKDLVKIVHGDPEEFTAVLFCGSGTLNIDACVSSLVPENGTILVLDNGSYSHRAAEVAEYYHMNCIDLKMPITRPVDTEKMESVLKDHPEVTAVYCCMHETGTGVLNPVREIGALAHKYGKIMIADTTSAYAMIPIDIEDDNLDFIMASAQKGLMSFTGLSFVIGRRSMIEESKNYRTRSYYTNLYMQYKFIRDSGQMHFTPPVQTIYATRQAILEYWDEGEQAKWKRHEEVWKRLYQGLDRLGFHMAIQKEYQSHLVIGVLYPHDSNFDFYRFHDALYDRGFTIYPGKVTDMPMFRLCSLGALVPEDAEDLVGAIEEVLKEQNVEVPCRY